MPNVVGSSNIPSSQKHTLTSRAQGMQDGCILLLFLLPKYVLHTVPVQFIGLLQNQRAYYLFRPCVGTFCCNPVNFHVKQPIICGNMSNVENDHNILQQS